MPPMLVDSRLATSVPLSRPEVIQAVGINVIASYYLDWGIMNNNNSRYPYVMSIANILCFRKLVPTRGGSSSTSEYLPPHTFCWAAYLLSSRKSASHQKPQEGWICLSEQASAECPATTSIHHIFTSGQEWRQAETLRDCEPAYDVDHRWFSSSLWSRESRARCHHWADKQYILSISQASHQNLSAS